MILSGYIASLRMRKGLSLIELLIALMLGLVVSLGVYKVYQSNIATHKLQKKLAEVQRTGRFALDAITRNVNSAGYAVFFGVFSDNVENLLATPDDMRWDTHYAVIGFDNVKQSDELISLTGFAGGTDALLIRQTVDPEPILSNPDDYTFVVNTASDIALGDILLATSANHATVFQVSSTTLSIAGKVIKISSSGLPGNTAGVSLDYSYASDLSHLRSVMYFIKEGTNKRNALYQATLKSDGDKVIIDVVELVSNIDDMQIQYGIDEENDGVTEGYYDAASISDWGKVTSIGISILVSSDKKVIGASTKQYTYDAINHLFTQQSNTIRLDSDYLKRTFRVYIDLKNRMLNHL